MERLIRAIDGSEHSVVCLGCLDKGSLGIEALKPVYAGELFVVHQDFEIPIPGFMIVETRGHVQSLKQLTPREQAQFGVLLGRVEQAMDKELVVTEVTLIQQDSSSHFHVWMLPHRGWMSQYGEGIESLRPIMEHARAEVGRPTVVQRVEAAAKKLRRVLAYQSLG